MEIGIESVRRPLIGILTIDDDNNNFRGNRENFIDIIQTGRELGVDVVVLTPSDLNPLQHRVYGYRYDPSQKNWKRHIIPLPHVIYNRIPNRDDEMMPEVQQVIKACIKHPYVQLFNPAFFNKWTLFEWLKKAKLTRRHIPTTRRLTKKLSLKKLLMQHSLLYLKPESGKAGKGIMRLRCQIRKPYPYYLSVQNYRKSQTFRHKTIQSLRKQLTEMIGDESYIVQQGITLARYQNRPFDLRVLVQKNKTGRWSISGVGARIAGNASITTHVPRGGSIEEPYKALNDKFGNTSAKLLLANSKKTALRIARQIEKGAGCILGEMSMDLGVDTSGHIWFFEANAKPMKFDEPDIRKKSLNQLLKYSLFLAKKRKRVLDRRT